LIYAVSGCSQLSNNDQQSFPEPTRETMESFDTAIVGKANEFGINLFEEIFDKSSNTFISPISIFTALAMTYNGADEETN
jgi:serine protease inhibitor